MKLIKTLSIIFFTLAVFLFGLFVAFVFITRTEAEGTCMEPTLHNGDKVYKNFLDSPEVNDIISFDCLHKCDEDQKLLTLDKRLIAIDDQGCYWVEGDNKPVSYDSRYFGWLCPEDIDYVATVLFSF